MSKILTIARFSWPYLKPYWGRATLGLTLGVLFGMSNAGVLWLTKTMLTRLEPKVEATVPSPSTPVVDAGTPDVLEALSPETSSWLKQSSRSFSQSVDRAVDPWLPTWGRPIDRYQVIGILIFLPFLVALRSGANFLSTYCMNWTGQNIINNLRVKVLDNLSKLSIDYFNRSTLGDMVVRINGDTKTLQRCLTNGIDHIIKDPITIISVFTWLLLIDWQLTVSSVILLPICMFPVLILGRMARRASKKMRNIDVIQASMVIEILSGIRVVKAFCLEGEMVNRFRKLSRSLVGQTMRAIRATEMTGPIIETVSIFGVGAIILFVAFTDRNIPDLVTFFLGLIMFYDPVKKLAKLHLLIERTSVGIERLMNILTERPSVKESSNPVRLDTFKKEITLENLTFTYGHNPVLKNLSLTIPQGTTLGIAGESGSGKSTLVNLLFRFFDPTEGTIRIDGHDVKSIATEDLRQLMALVSQEVVVFDQTVYENIACGKKNATREEVEEAARAAYAHEFISQLPEGYETRLGERGVTLSGGQRQRISIARAFIRNSPILILDEATAALDSQSEGEVQKALDRLSEHRTVISIAHRLATLTKSDNLIVLSQGTVVEQGSFSDLLQAGGHFSSMAEKQGIFSASPS
jgi:subfamily B ATP-binding cassette protein MsbA